MPKGHLVENTLELWFQPPVQADGFNKANGYLHQWEDHMGLFLAPGIGMGKGMIEMIEILRGGEMDTLTRKKCSSLA